MVQSGEIAPSQLSINSIDELITAAKQDKVEKAIIQSDPKGGEEWYVIQGKIKNPAYELDETQYKTLPFVVKGRVTNPNTRTFVLFRGTVKGRAFQYHLDGPSF